MFGIFSYMNSHYFCMADSELVLGIGVFLIWIKTIKFFDGVYPYDIMPKTLLNAAPTLIRVITGVIPFLIGATCFCAIFFSESAELFGTFSSSINNVFSL